LTAGGRAVRSAGLSSESSLAALLDNGHVSKIANVFDDAPDGAGRTMSVAGTSGRRASSAGEPRLIELAPKKGTSAAKLAAHVQRMKEVEYAFVPPVRRAFAKRARRTAAVDPLDGRLWGHGAIRLGHARSASGFKDARDITVAVIDTGIDASHPELEDVIVEYKNFIGGSDKDFVGHGTHVSGIIAATANNGIGLSGVSSARILALKVLPRAGEEFDAPAYYRALRYVIGRAQVLNLSLGGGEDPAEIDVLEDVIASGVVVVAAMGNEYEEGNPTSYPAAIPAVCAVGATDRLDKRAPFSNTGRHIDLVAPGVDILSTTPLFRYDGDGEREYDAWDGTSMATPHVAAAAALLLAKSPNLSPAQVIKKLTGSADRVAGAKKGSTAYGAGRLNVEKLLR
jgi:subtilisin family serine protease